MPPEGVGDPLVGSWGKGYLDGGLVGDVLQSPVCARPWTASYVVPASKNLNRAAGWGDSRGQGSAPGGTKGPEVKAQRHIQSCRTSPQGWCERGTLPNRRAPRGVCPARPGPRAVLTREWASTFLCSL